jgi:hypothetical protein
MCMLGEPAILHLGLRHIRHREGRRSSLVEAGASYLAIASIAGEVNGRLSPN